ncbi:2Fe-2S iron-sulfur cluster-binding protein [Aquisalimonas sp.]|uniref:2Fe-2S iron-sulfur cluster-binding protein n=1 Tax=Aquisalimonas sp. TaxID=1872621 RepID=UPI0025B8F0D4|nr:2Fe-2S iron-sulfur cluster-binding protein [Aquisalimonas sp.]
MTVLQWPRTRAELPGTKEGLRRGRLRRLHGPNGALHPTQQALVECHGSQCCFYTPGFVMSLFAMYHSEKRPSRQRIQDVLAGTLCRCTGYRPIIAAAERMYGLGSNDHFSATEKETVERLRALRGDDRRRSACRARRGSCLRRRSGIRRGYHQLLGSAVVIETRRMGGGFGGKETQPASAPGTAMPTEAKPLEIIQVLGRFAG